MVSKSSLAVQHIYLLQALLRNLLSPCGYLPKKSKVLITFANREIYIYGRRNILCQEWRAVGREKLARQAVGAGKILGETGQRRSCAAYEHSLNTEPYLGTPLAVVSLLDSVKLITAEFIKRLDDPARPPVNVDRGAIREALAKTTKALDELAHTDFSKVPVESTASFARKAFTSAFNFMDKLSTTSNLLNAGKIGLQASGNADDPSVNVFMLTLQGEVVAIAVLGGNFTDLTDLGVSPEALIAKMRRTGTRLFAWIATYNPMPEWMTLIPLSKNAAGYYESLGAEYIGNTSSMKFNRAALEAMVKKYAYLLDNTEPKARIP
ncbi:hypothetical protein EVG20_g6746 [Dentipellis fragilis]|uniref:Uncharacterized protein n=1 Tax=Dentipellis fragilis TaxID=205917 RepID=A0A4Y9YIG6_9AGAM|nr:hypothetical protein EVG20_g6746 [Dentipellis fragilis]